VLRSSKKFRYIRRYYVRARAHIVPAYVTKLLGRPKRCLQDNNKVKLKAIGWECTDCIIVVQQKDWWLALVSTVIKPSDSTVCGKFLG